MTSSIFRWVGVAFCLLYVTANASAQGNPDLLSQSSRVALLPFATLMEDPEIAPQVMAKVRKQLQANAVDLADSGAVADVLRKYRIRNTTDLSLGEAQSVAAETDARYLILGSVDRYDETDSTAEVAFSARLLDVPSSRIVWANSAVVHGDPRTHVFGMGAHHAETLAMRAIRELFKGFRHDVPPKQKMVQAIRMRGGNPVERPCRKIVIVTFGNESATHFAGNIVANELFSALFKRGFTLIDPGRVREIMLDSKKLMQGEISSQLMARCNQDLGADFVLTGTVSRFESVRGPQFEEPTVAFEARLIDVTKGEVVWAKTYSREGKDSSWIFNLGYVHGLTIMSQRLTHRLAWDLPVRRARLATPANLAEERNP